MIPARLSPSIRELRSARRALLATALSLASLGATFDAAHAADALNYRGTLQDAGKPANGSFELELRVFDAATGGKALTETISLSNVEVRDGVFEVPLDVGADLSMQPEVFLEAAIRAPGDATFQPLAGRQQIKGGSATCWVVDGNNDLGTGTLGLISPIPSGLLTLRSGSQNVYLRNGGGLEQAGSTASGSNSTAMNNSQSAGALSAAFNTASAAGAGSFAAGRGQVPAAHASSFVFADSQAAVFSTNAADQFAVRARSGVGINAAPPDVNVELTVTATAGAGDLPDIWLRPNPAITTNAAGIMLTAGNAATLAGLNLNNAGFYIDNRSSNGANFFRRMALEPNGSVNIRSSTNNANAGVTMAEGAGSWSSLSDRNMKTAIVPADVLSILDRVVSMPMSTWSYIAQGEGVRHIGPMAQDFAASFGLGENDTTISTIDADGVALAAIQGLNAKLEAENAELHERLAAIEASLQALQSAGAR
jgi:hypothetical protein